MGRNLLLYFHPFLANGILSHSSCLGTPQENGRVEGKDQLSMSRQPYLFREVYLSLFGANASSFRSCSTPSNQSFYSSSPSQ